MSNYSFIIISLNYFFKFHSAGVFVPQRLYTLLDKTRAGADYVTRCIISPLICFFLCNEIKNNLFIGGVFVGFFVCFSSCVQYCTVAFFLSWMLKEGQDNSWMSELE